MLALAQWLEGTPLSLAIQKAEWLIPLLQTIHILAIAMVLSSVGMIELRVLGGAKASAMLQTADRFVPWIWTGLTLLALTGLALIVGEPRRALPNPAFQIKLILIAIAVATTLAFQLSLRSGAGFWDQNSSGRRLTSALAVAVFVVWCAIAVAGRWIAYVKTD